MDPLNDCFQIWAEVEGHCQCEIPSHLKEVLKVTNYDKYCTLANATLDIIPELEGIIKSDTYFKNLPENPTPTDLSKVYGIFGKNRQDFKFYDGERILLQEIINFAKSKYEKRNTEYFDLSNYTEEKRTLLSVLVDSAKSLAVRSKPGYRYEFELKLVCSYLRIVGGPQVYETLANNLPIPSISAVNKYIYASEKIVEGEVRASACKQFLEANRYPLAVYLSEDGTRKLTSIEYDSSTNQLVGFVLPLDENAMPVTYSYEASSVKQMVKHFNEGTLSNTLYVIMAQPLQENASPFCLCIFGTNNSFTSLDCVKRWKYLKKCLNEVGIQVIGHSADGDPKLLGAMCHVTKLGIDQPAEYTFEGYTIKMPYFHAIICDIILAEDVVHILTKLRNRLFKDSITFPMGFFLATKSQLKILISIVGKDKHFLTESDVNLLDRMNFKNAYKVCHSRVIRLLKEHVPNSDGTQAYLKLMNFNLQAFLCKSLTIAERLYKMWYVIFFVRMWRKFLSEGDSAVTHSFITQNCYTCIELNGHALLQMILYCLHIKSFDWFYPWLYSSQACESFFRLLRSLTTTQSTVVNFSTLQAINKIRRTEILQKILAYDFEKAGFDINMPRKSALNASYETVDKDNIDTPAEYANLTHIDLPTIDTILNQAKNDAWQSIKELGMSVELEDADECFVKKNAMPNDEIDDVDVPEETPAANCVEISDESIEERNELDGDVTFLADFDDLQLRDYTEKTSTLTESSPFLLVRTPNNKEKVIRKSTICWLLSKGTHKLSNDRLHRVKNSDLSKNQISLSPFEGTVDVLETIQIGDYCLFIHLGSSKCWVGCVMQFAYYEQRTWKEIEFTKNFVSIKDNVKSVGVLCQWYAVGTDGCLTLRKDVVNHGYYDIKYYKMTILAPKMENGQILLDRNVFLKIKDYLDL